MKSKLPLLSILLVTCVQLCFGQETNDKRIATLESQFEKVLKDWHCAGFAVAVVDKDKIIYAKGFGYRDYEKKIPVTANTLFAIGSCTKSFTVSLVGMLAKDKLVDIDKPVHDNLPSLRFFNKTMTDNITPRDMMSHRTGLPRHDYSWYLFSSSSRDSLLQRIEFMEPTAGVKDQWQYNNFMFLSLGVMAEKLTGQKWEDNIRTRIFLPLGMKRSNFSIPDMVKDNDASVGYFVKNDSVVKKMNYYNIDAMGPAGSINSCVNEMSSWVVTWIHGGKCKGKEIIPEAFAKEAMSSQMIAGSGFPDKEVPDVFFSTYGFGWFLSSYRGHYRVEHGGNIDGFSASTSFFPMDSIGIIVLTNQNNSLVPSIIRNLVADKLLNAPYIDWSANRQKVVDIAKKAAEDAKKNNVSQRKMGTKPSHPLKDYEGMYANPGYGTLELFTAGDSLFAKLTGKVLWLRHYNYDVFEVFEKDPEWGIDTTNEGLKTQFHMDVNGNIISLAAAFEPTLKPIEFTRKEKEVPMMAADLEKYTGNYDLNGTEVKIYTKTNVLYAFIPGQPEYELTYVGNNKFNLRILNGYSVQFTSDDKNNIISLSFVQPNGIFKATRKK